MLAVLYGKAVSVRKREESSRHWPRVDSSEMDHVLHRGAYPRQSRQVARLSHNGKYRAGDPSPLGIKRSSRVTTGPVVYQNTPSV